MREMYDIEVRGKYKKWSFPIEAEASWVEDWRNDGLIVNKIVNVIPQWYVDMGFPVKVWVFFQDLLNFNNPFQK
jgi:hypothetical protein